MVLWTRNLQGITVVDGVVYENEHGPMGGDELNIAEPAKIMDGLYNMEKTIAEQPFHLSQKRR